jgi:hypothetical protein
LAALFTSPNVEEDSQGNVAAGAATANMMGYSVDGISTATLLKSRFEWHWGRERRP